MIENDETVESLKAEVAALRKRVAELEQAAPQGGRPGSTDSLEQEQELHRVLEERRRAEDAQRAADAELRALFEAMNDVIVVMNWEGRYLKIAPTSPNPVYKPSPDLLGKTIHDAIPTPVADELLAHARRAIETGQVISTEYSLTIDGSEFWFLGTVSPMLDDTVIFVARDITERKRAEHALRTRQEELIRAQSEALAELSTPLIPISDEIVVMPLIGLLDTQRAQQVMTTLLTGISESGAQVAILDITGVSVVDTQVANGLIRAARAARLLGAEVVLTGIRPEVARTLVGLGADLGDIVTRGKLQSGIAFALNRSQQEAEPREELERPAEADV